MPYFISHAFAILREILLHPFTDSLIPKHQIVEDINETYFGDFLRLSKSTKALDEKNVDSEKIRQLELEVAKLKHTKVGAQFKLIFLVVCMFAILLLSLAVGLAFSSDAPLPDNKQQLFEVCLDAFWACLGGIVGLLSGKASQ